MSLRTPEQMEWIRERFQPDGLARLARSTQDYYDQKGYYLPDVAALAHANGVERDALEAALRETVEAAAAYKEAVRLAGAYPGHEEYVESEWVQLQGEKDAADMRLAEALEAARALVPDREPKREPVSLLTAMICDVANAGRK